MFTDVLPNYYLVVLTAAVKVASPAMDSIVGNVVGHEKRCVCSMLITQHTFLSMASWPHLMIFFTWMPISPHLQTSTLDFLLYHAPGN